MQIAVEYIRWLVEERAKINRVPLESIEFFENGMKLDIQPEVLEEWRFVGLNNIDFITTNEYSRILPESAASVSISHASEVSAEADSTSPATTQVTQTVRHSMQKCLSCGKENKNLKTIQSRGYLWHVPCAKVFSHSDGTLYVDFPSDGKIAPSTIMRAPNIAHAANANVGRTAQQDYQELLRKYMQGNHAEPINGRDSMVLTLFCIWLNNNAAQQSVQADEPYRCARCGSVNPNEHFEYCPSA